jgi:hypothetical protein
VLGLYSELLLRSLQTGVGGVVETLVPEAADVQHDRRAYVGRATAVLTTPTAAATAGGYDQRQ